MSPTEEEEKYKQRISALLEFFELNKIDPGKAVTMCMRCIIIICKGLMTDEQIINSFKIMVKAINGEKEERIEL